VKPPALFSALIWVMTVVLIVVFLLLQLADTASESHPSAMSDDPSGSSAYAQLLERLGYEVEISRSRHPKLGSNDIAILYQVHGGSRLFETDSRKEAEDKLKSYGFANALVLYLDRDFRLSSKNAESGARIYNPLLQAGIQLSIGRPIFLGGSKGFGTLDGAENSIEERRHADLFVYHAYMDPFVVHEASNGRNVIHVADGLGSTNRFLDKEQNAAFFSGILRFFNAGRKVVFIEDSISASPRDSLLDVLAPWSGPARLQAYLLMILTVWLMGRRFGLPEVTRFSQRGTKELADAVADTLMRGRSTDFALAQIVDDCERRLRNALKAGSDVKRQELVNLLPGDVGVPFARCLAALDEKAQEAEAAELAARLEGAVDRFLGRYPRSHPRRRSKV